MIPKYPPTCIAESLYEFRSTTTWLTTLTPSFPGKSAIPREALLSVTTDHARFASLKVAVSVRVIFATSVNASLAAEIIFRSFVLGSATGANVVPPASTVSPG